jgi:hypothetical protein
MIQLLKKKKKKSRTGTLEACLGTRILSAVLASVTDQRVARLVETATAMVLE